MPSAWRCSASRAIACSRTRSTGWATGRSGTRSAGATSACWSSIAGPWSSAASWRSAWRSSSLPSRSASSPPRGRPDADHPSAATPAAARRRACAWPPGRSSRSSPAPGWRSRWAGDTRVARPRKQAKDYWRKNLATYRDAKRPRHHPRRSRPRALSRDRPAIVSRAPTTWSIPPTQPLREIVLTGGLHWEDLSWTFDDKPYTPTDRAAALRLHAAPAARPRPDGPDRLPATRGRFPRGISKRGGAAMEFILPSGVVLTSFSPSIVPDPRLQWTRSASRTTTATRPRNTPTTSTRDRPTRSLGARAPFTTRDQDHRARRFHAQLGGDQDRGDESRAAAGPWSGRAIIPSASSTSWRGGGT